MDFKLRTVEKQEAEDQRGQGWKDGKKRLSKLGSGSQALGEWELLGREGQLGTLSRRHRDTVGSH